MAVRKVCKCCGSEDVVLDAWLSWNKDDQEWVLDAIHDDGFCHACDAAGDIIVEEEILEEEDEPEQAMTAAELHDAGEFIELDMGGTRFTRYGKGITLEQSTCLCQPYMNASQWKDKLGPWLRQQPPEIGIYYCRFKPSDPGRLIRTAAEQLLILTGASS